MSIPELQVKFVWEQRQMDFFLFERIAALVDTFYSLLLDRGAVLKVLADLVAGQSWLPGRQMSISSLSVPWW